MAVKPFFYHSYVELKPMSHLKYVLFIWPSQGLHFAQAKTKAYAIVYLCYTLKKPRQAKSPKGQKNIKAQ